MIANNLVIPSLSKMSNFPSPSHILQGTFVMAAATVSRYLPFSNKNAYRPIWQIILVNSIPSLRKRLIVYGPRATPASKTDDVAQPSDQTPSGYLQQAIDGISKLQVPHSYFKYFYFVSVASSMFWLAQLLTQGSVLKTICQAETRSRTPNNSMSLNQSYISWFLMVIQGGRRLSECFTLMKKSASSMWCVHWLLGMAFYLAVGTGVWIAGAGMLHQYDLPFLMEDDPTTSC